jgi:hypothetical protein
MKNLSKNSSIKLLFLLLFCSCVEQKNEASSVTNEVVAGNLVDDRNYKIYESEYKPDEDYSKSIISEETSILKLSELFGLDNSKVVISNFYIDPDQEVMGELVEEYLGTYKFRFLERCDDCQQTVLFDIKNMETSVEKTYSVEIKLRHSGRNPEFVEIKVSPGIYDSVALDELQEFVQRKIAENYRQKRIDVHVGQFKPLETLDEHISESNKTDTIVITGAVDLFDTSFKCDEFKNITFYFPEKDIENFEEKFSDLFSQAHCN